MNQGIVVFPTLAEAHYHGFFPEDPHAAQRRGGTHVVYKRLGDGRIARALVEGNPQRKHLGTE